MWIQRFAILQIGLALVYCSLSDVESKQTTANVFECLGYSPTCVASALASCELTSDTECSINDSDLHPELKALLQKIKTERKQTNHSTAVTIDNSKKVTYYLAEMKSTLQEMKQARDCAVTANTSKNISQTLTAILATLENMKPKEKLPKNCAELRVLGDTNSGVRTVYPYGYFNPRGVNVSCDQTTDGGGWTVFQNRDALPIRENFNRTWNEYVDGFGDLTGEFWLGLDNIHALTSSTKMELRIDLEDYEGAKRWAKYGNFEMGDDFSKFTLRIEQFSGDAGDSLAYHNGMKFSTFDEDNDLSSALNCAIERKGAWMYNNCNHSNLNGYQYVGKHSSRGDGIMWDNFRGFYYSLKKTSMKVRPVSMQV